jgi:hypothetical protein
MRRITVKWGKFKLEIPGEMFLLLAIKTFLFLHNLSG